MASLVAYGAAVLCALLFGTGLALSPDDRLELAGAAVAGIAAAGVGAMVVARDIRNRIGQLLLAIGLLPAVQLVARIGARRADDHDTAAWLGWLATWPMAVWIVLLLVVLPLLFPDGRLPSRGWRPVGVLTAVALALAVSSAFLAGPLDLWDGDAFTLDNPLGASPVGGLLDGLGDAYFPLVMLLTVLAVASLALRYRRSGTEVRQQLRWVLFAVGLLTAAVLVNELPPPHSTAPAVSALTTGLVIVALAGVPLAAGIAVLRYRLYDLDVVVNRVAVHGSLVLAVTGVYLAAVAASGALVGGDRDASTGLVVAALMSVLLQPLRERLQRAVNQLTFGFRSSPGDAIAALTGLRSSVSSHEALLVRAAEQVGRALRMERVELRSPDGELLAAAGPVTTAPVTQRPLVLRGVVVGQLLLASRSRRLTASDRPLLEGVGDELALCLEAVALHQDLAASRTALVTAREEERRRLRRDLHDGLGSVLTGIALKLQAAANSWRTDAPAAEALARQAEQDVRRALDDLRRLLQGLRPPALEELGLAGAVRVEVDRLAGATATRTAVEESGPLDELPAAVEVAAYRIVVEALNNVNRHAGASRCDVLLTLDDELVLEIRDDGVGLPAALVPGIGLSSIRERTEELGGTWSVCPAQGGGVVVRVTLPVEVPEELTS